MVNIQKIIDGLEDYESYVGCAPSRIEDAIKVLRMWRRLRLAAKNWDMGEATKLQIHRIMNDIEAEFFPPLETRVISIKVELPINEGQARVTQIMNYTKKKLKVFKDVKEVSIE